jgi:hypothetical protein
VAVIDTQSKTPRVPRVVAGGDLYVARVERPRLHRFLESGSAEANARLIAAAPDLLAILQRIRATPAAYEALAFDARDELDAVLAKAVGP